MDDRLTRRRYMYTTGITGLVGLSGCSDALTDNDTSEQDTTTHQTSNLHGAEFTFDYSPENDEAKVTFNGGAPILAGDLELRATSGKQVLWAELGSTVAAPDEQLSTGATAVLGESTINWQQPVSRDATIRLVHVGKETPATLGRFTPPSRTTLTTTIPQTTAAPTTEPTTKPPATTQPTPTTTERTASKTSTTESETTTPTTTTTSTTPSTTAPTTTKTQDTTTPSIAAFSIANPGSQRVRVSFDTDEQLATITVSLEGAISQSLTTPDFSISSNQSGGYTYEASLDAGTTGEITASLLEASDQAGNDGASDETVSLTIQASIPEALDTVFHHKLNGSYADAVNDITGKPASDATSFTDSDRGKVLSLTGRNAGDDAGYYDIPYDALTRHVDGGTAITTAFWTRPDALDRWYVFFVGTGITVNIRNGKLRINRWDRQTRDHEYKATVDAEKALTAATWHHIIATIDPGNEARLFVDGEQVASTSVDSDQGFKQKQGNNIDAARVGWVASGIDGPDAHYQGEFDDFRFFTGSINEDGASQLYDIMQD